MTRLWIRLVLLFLVLLASSNMRAQSPQTTGAIVPAQLQSAKAVFLGSGGSPAFGPRDLEVTSWAYDSMYRALVRAGYTVQPAPKGADLTMEVSIFDGSSVMNGNSIGVAVLSLAIFDPESHTRLWTVDQNLDGAFRASTMRKNLAQAANAVTEALKTLASGKLPAE